MFVVRAVQRNNGGASAAVVEKVWTAPDSCNPESRYRRGTVNSEIGRRRFTASARAVFFSLTYVFSHVSRRLSLSIHHSDGHHPSLPHSFTIPASLSVHLSGKSFPPQTLQRQICLRRVSLRPDLSVIIKFFVLLAASPGETGSSKCATLFFSSWGLLLC